MQGNSPVYLLWFIKQIRLNRKLKPNISLNGVAGFSNWGWGGGGGGGGMSSKIVYRYAKEQATKKRYQFITLEVQHSVHLFLHA